MNKISIFYVLLINSAEKSACVPASVVQPPSSSHPPAHPAVEQFALMNTSSPPAEPPGLFSSPPEAALGPELLPCSSPHTSLSDPQVLPGSG